MSITDYKLQINALELLKWLIIAILAVLIVFLPSISYLNFCLIILALLIVSYRRPILMFGLAILLYPFNQNYWQVGWELNIPYADLIIIIVGIVWFWQQIIYLWQEKKIQISQQAKINLVCLLLLVLTGSLSLLNIWPEQLAESLKYFWRFGIFYFLLYYFLTQELLKKANKLWAAVWCMSAVGLFLSIMGVLSLLWPEIRHVIPMATPLSWWGLFPFGASHNLLAESLLAIFPLTWLLAYKYQEESFSRWLYLTVALMIGIILLTFSRAGWLTLALELLILGIGYYQRKIRSVILQYWWILIIALIPLFIYLLTFGQTDFVLSSNAARLSMTEKAWSMFLDHPLVGTGIGTWQAIASRDPYFIMEFGQPVEQHGYILKILPEQGIIGLLVWCGILLYIIGTILIIYRSLNSKNPWRVVALVALVIAVGQIFFQLFDTGYYSIKMWLPIGIAMALASQAKKYIKY
ncbi:MAG: hypothetical protein COX77_03720 [Candidatus Komeilibacteria bacterium CG_4_10_14_0_2_um_filter_37_10]|uniref:O-antigen ligase-related domain-containing protein n=1 Tax=Candidatus Komeilibacteria bacterium CG_4_10_14_0_2_um_filter_37_10 TaxID=1974470 RepID=A0A2M7VE10_9BACT|nr:MAG: hypothetical protein COX77_03720 [Candidatus Komeilibacteria bacterium CG_4_10_14_0_2_um_filter_37_10]